MGVVLPKYPNFPQTFFAQPRATADVYYNNASGSTLTAIANSDFNDGRNVLQLTFNSNANAIVGKPAAFSSPVDVRGGSFTWWMKMASAVSGLATFSINLYSAGSPAAPSANGHFWGSTSSLSDTATADVWNKIGGAIGDFAAFGTGADLSAITYALMFIKSTGATKTLLLSDFQFVPNPRTKGVVVISMDDAHEEANSILKSLLDAAGVPMALYPGAVVSAQGYDQNGRMTTAEVNAARNQAVSWQSGTQSFEAETSLSTEADYLTRHRAMIAYNVAKGWTADAADGSYYSGVNIGTPFVRKTMLQAGSRTIRKFMNGNPSQPPLRSGESFPPRDATIMSALNIASPGGSGAAITTQIGSELDRTINNKGLLFISGHDDMATNSNQLDAINYVLGRYASDHNFDITTMRDLLKPYETLYGTTSYPIVT